MFEAHVLNLLRKYLGQYVHGLSEEALKISVWKGDVVLNNLQLKAEALNGLHLPITVKAGFLGSVRLKVPWNRLGKDPVIVLLDRIFILAEPLSEEVILQGDGGSVEDKSEAKRASIEELELSALAAKGGRRAQADVGSESSSWLGSLIATVVGNLKVSITKVHIRYEDTQSHIGHPFCIGITLGELAAFTVDDEGKETFVTSGALDRLRKAMQLDRLAMYHDSDSEPWQIDKAWDKVSPAEWSQMFEPDIKDNPDSLEKEKQSEHFLLHPVDGSMRYLRQGKHDRREPDIPYQKGALRLREVAISLSERQYVDMMRLLDLITTIKLKQELVHLHPRVPVKGHPVEWWHFAFRGVLHQQQALRQRLNWSEIQRLASFRKKYLEAYTEALLALPPDKQTADTPVIREYDAQLNTDLIVLWRLLAHSIVDKKRPKEETPDQAPRQTGWLGYLWGGSRTAQNKKDDPAEAEGLSKEEWDKIDELVSYEPGAESPLAPAQEGQEAPNMLQLAMDVTIERTALNVIRSAGDGVMAGAFVGLQAGMRMYPKMTAIDLKVTSYGLTAPEGTLIESVGREGKEGVMKAAFVYSPVDQPNLDWLLSATMTPCHITVWRASVDRLVQFIKSGQAVNPGLALETAAALQSKLDNVRKQAGEQLQAVLQNQRRFSVNLDVDAPKIAIPVELTEEGGAKGTQLLLDLGHFTFDTDEDPPAGEEEQREAALYTRFKLRGTDISAFLVDGAFQWSAGPPLHQVGAPACGTGGDEGDYTSGQPATFIMPVLDRCGISAVLQQLTITHPSYPVTRIAVWLPRIGFHFSPSRYHRLMSVINAVTSSTVAEESQQQEEQKPWQPADHSGPAWDLTWGGIGSTLAEWQPRWAALVGAYLYVLESESAPTYRNCTSLVGKTVVEVPAEKIGDTPHVLAICNRGMDMSKVVMPRQAQLLRFPSMDAKADWFNALTLAMYKASGRAAVTLPRGASAKEVMSGAEGGKELGQGELQELQPEQQDAVQAGVQQLIYILGVLDQLMVSISVTEARVKDGGEIGILEMRASGGKVELLQRTSDLSIGVGVHALEMVDLLQGRVDPNCRYMARSLITTADTTFSPDGRQKGTVGEDAQGGDKFTDAREEFLPISPNSAPATPRQTSGGSRRGGWESRIYYEAEDPPTNGESGVPENITPSFSRAGNLLPGTRVSEGGATAGGERQSDDFVKLQLLMRQPTSPDYDGVDTQMLVAMATLEFFCNRPTVAALAEFGVQLARSEPLEKSEESADLQQQPEHTRAEEQAGSLEAEGEELHEEAVTGLEKQLEPKVMKGLLGTGQARVVFRLRMDLERARFFLNLEDGSRLAMLEQERMSFDLKMFPSSMSIAATLGNLRFCDMRLGPEHQWGWLCDLRDSDCSSLIQLEFQSHNPEEDGFEGYEYSLKGQLSAVRIVFLYRFVQELLAYLTGLSTPSTTQIAAKVDAKGGIERALTVSDMAGQPAIRLAIAMDAPVIIIPRSSGSSDFIQLNLGHLQVSNKVEWRGGEKVDPSAVHVDTMVVESRDVSVDVGVDGKLGDPLVQELGAITVQLQRPLRDLDKLLPSVQLQVQIGNIRAAMSDREYTIITECVSANMAEPANLPSDFRKKDVTEDAAPQEHEPLDPQVEESVVAGQGGTSQMTDKQGAVAASSVDSQAVYTTVRVAIHMQLAQLELFTGPTRDTPLSLFEVQGLWVEYRSNNVAESEVLLSVLKMSVLDQRVNTRPEMRLTMGSVLDVDPAMGVTQRATQEANLADGPAALTMVVLNWVVKPSSRVLDIRLQRPRLLVALDFVLALCEFFVPSLGAMAGKDDDKDVREDPLGLQHDIRLTEPQHSQTDVEVFLSPVRQLVADGEGYDEFVYDGCDHKLWLLEEDGDGISGAPAGPLVRVGDGKHLRFQNINIQNGEHLDACVQLGSNSSYSASEADGVHFVGSGLAPTSEASREQAGNSTSAKDSTQAAAASNFAIDIQAVAPELTFYDSTKWAPGTTLRPEKLLRVKLDLNVLLALKGPDMYMLASLRGFMVETAGALTVVEPLDMVADFQKAAGKTILNLTSTDLAIRMPLNVMRLLLRLQTDVMAALRFGGGPPVSRCSSFDLIWRSPPGERSEQQIAIWRPRAPSGYAIGGDCLTAGKEPPSQAVLAISKGFRRVRKPTGYDLAWASSDLEDACRVWMPRAPPGYVALGCIARCSKEPPPRSDVHCIRADLLTSSSIADCPYFNLDGPPSTGRGTLWRVDNSVSSFWARADGNEPPRVLARDLREELRFSVGGQAEGAAGSSAPRDASSPASGLSRSSTQARIASSRQESYSRQSSKVQGGQRLYNTTPDTERVWWSKGGDTRGHVTIWRPVPPPGYAVFGDIAVEGFERPDSGLVVLDDLESGRLAKPTGFLERAQLTGRGWQDASVWFPVAPPGYIALGCIATPSHNQPPVSTVRCIRMDLVSQKSFGSSPVWSYSAPARGQPAFALWAVDNQANTFMAAPDNKKPQWRLAFSLAELEKPRAPANIDASIKIPRVSATMFDDFSGELMPLMDASISDIQLAVHGRTEALSAVVFTSVAASTYNPQLGVWEPLIEGFDGIFKYESKAVGEGAGLVAGTNVRITTTSAVQVNISLAGLDTFASAYLAWGKAAADERASEDALHMKQLHGEIGEESSPALDQEEGVKLHLDNQLAQPLYAKTTGEESVHVVEAGETRAVPLPRQRIADLIRPLGGDMPPRPPRHFMAIRIIEAQKLLSGDGIAGKEYVCYLRVAAPGGQAGPEGKLMPQSARSRGVPASSTSGAEDGTAARWDECFVFEIPTHEEGAQLELVVTNQAANAGKGAAVGAAVIPMARTRSSARESHWNAVKAALSIGTSSWENVGEQRLDLHLTAMQASNTTDSPVCGTMVVATFFFSVGKSGHVQTVQAVIQDEMESRKLEDAAVQIASNPEGPWVPLRPMAAVMTVAQTISGRNLALEASMQKGQKCVSLRSLATLVNSTECILEVAVTPRVSINQAEGVDIADEAEEEIYENQRFQPLMGWGSSWPGHLLPSDPARFCSRTLTTPLQELPQKPAPGWEWTSTWRVAAGRSSDPEGWVYGPDFKALARGAHSVPAGTKGPMDFVRRRRLVRARRHVRTSLSSSTSSNSSRGRQVVGRCRPGASLVLPWASLAPGSDLCLQVRPVEDGQPGAAYAWSKIVPKASASFLHGGRDGHGGDEKRGNTKREVQVFKLGELSSAKEASKREDLLQCMGAKNSWWLCLDADSVRLHGEGPYPAYDWRLTARAPLKLENRLPCSAEYVVFEKPTRAGQNSRPHAVQRGVVDSGGGVQVHSVDIQCPVLLTFFPQGGWKPEKEAVVISDPFAAELPGSLSLVHSRSNRKLRVSIENDMGATEVSAKIIRLFVPYWLRNDGELPLHYRLVEIEPPTGTMQRTDSLWLARATKAAKDADPLPAKSSSSGVGAGPSKVVSTVAVMEETVGTRPVMLSLPKNNENLGLSIALSPAGSFSQAVAFRAFEDKNERLELRAVDPGGEYFRLALSLDLSSLGFERTKVVRIQPFAVYTNHLGCSIKLRQSGCAPEHLLPPEARGQPLRWHSVWEPELLQVAMEGHQWSQPFSVDAEGTMHILLRGLDGKVKTVLRAEVCNGVQASRLHVLFRRASVQGPYKIENRSTLLPVRFRQVGSNDDAWQLLQAGSSSSFAWEDLRHERKIELMVDGADSRTARQLSIDNEAEFEPNTDHTGPVAALSISISRELSGVMCVRVSDWRPSDAYPEDWSLVASPFDPAAASGRPTTDISGGAAPAGVEAKGGADEEGGSGSMTVIQLHLDEFGLSLIDHTPEELLFLSMHAAHVSYDSSASTGTSRLKVRVGHLQLDNQLAQTAMPVLLAPQEAPGQRQEHVLKLSITSQSMRLSDEEWYRFIGIQLPSAAWLVNIHEPIVWRLHAMMQKLDLGRLSAPSQDNTAVAVDPHVRITLFHMLEARLKVTLAMAPTQRPRGILGFWSTLITSLGNTDEMPIRITEKVRENIFMRKSQLQSAAAQSITNDLLSQPFQLLSGLDVLGNASSALGHMSKGVAALSMDPTFIRARQRQESKASVEGLGDGLREGGEALAKGLFRGVTGILTKPMEAVREGGGMEGFMSGVGKGIIGAAAQPVSGVLDLVSKTTEGANVARMKLSAAISAKLVLERKRLPRAIRGDNILRPFDEYSARGQAILQLAERGTLFGSAIFDVKERGKFAMTDAYEDHHNLPKRQTLMISHRRVMLLQHPGAMSGKRADLLREPCTILWDVPWPELMTTELRHLKEEPPSSPPSLVILHLRDWSQESRLFESREIARIVQCHPATEQARAVQDSVRRAFNKYGPDRASVAAQTRERRAESKPYTGAASGAASGAVLGLLAGPAAPLAVPVMATFGALVGGAGQVMLEDDGQDTVAARERGARAPRQAASTPSNAGARREATTQDTKEPLAQAGKLTKQFGLVWSDRGAVWSNSYPVSIWRPVCPPGHVSVGDIVRAGYEPPEKAMVYRDDQDGRFVAPEGFNLVWRDTDSGAKSPVTIWTLQPPPGYVAIGCIAIADYYEPDRNVVRCVRRDCITAAELSRQPVWRDRKGAALWKCSVWQVLNDARTFLARRDHDSPASNLAFTVSV